MTGQEGTPYEGDGADTSPVVSVVIPLYNSRRFVDQTVKGVLSQTYRRLEVIVVDDGSTDDGPARVSAWSADQRFRLISRPHLGVAAARNAGAAECDERSRYVAFLDADDVWQPDTLATLVEAMERRPEAVGSFALADYIDEEGDVLHQGDFPRHMRSREELHGATLVPRSPTADVRFEHLFFSNTVYPPSCLLVRRAAFDAAGGFDGRFLSEDWEFLLRLASLGPLVPVDRVMVGYRRHGANASGNRSRNVHGARQVWAAGFHAMHHPPATQARLRGIWRANQMRASKRKLGEARELAASGNMIGAISRAADGLGHAALLWPPRMWMPHPSRSGVPAVRSRRRSRT